MSVKTFVKVLVLILLLSVSALAEDIVFRGYPSAEYGMKQGFYNCDTVWYVPFAASDPMVAKQLNEITSKYSAQVDWALALDCALTKDVLNDVYFINCAQTTIFSTQPGEQDYTPLWLVHYLEWAPGVTPQPLCSQAQVEAAILAGDLLEQGTPSVLDATIVVPTSGTPMVKVFDLNYRCRTVRFIAFPVFYFDRRCPWCNIREILITDVSEQPTNGMFANSAPRLVNASPDCCGCLEGINQPTPPGQLPIICEVPYYTPYGLNINQDYTPVLCLSAYDRTGLAPYAVVTSDEMLQRLVGLGLLTEEVIDPPIVFNSPIAIRSLNQ